MIGEKLAKALILVCWTVSTGWSVDAQTTPSSTGMTATPAPMSIQSGSISVSTQSALPIGLSLIIGKSALEFALNESSAVMNQRLSTLQLPTMRQNISGGWVEVAQAKVVNYTTPEYFYQLRAPNTVVWGFDDSNVTIDGQWSGQKTLVVPMKGSGGFRLSMQQFRLTLEADLVRDSKSMVPSVGAFRCNATIGSLSTRAAGGVVGYMLDVFRDAVSAYVKPSVQDAICDQLQKLIQTKFEIAILQQLPVKFELGRKFSLATTLAHDPVVDERLGEIKLDHAVDVQYDGHSQPLAIVHPVNSTPDTAPDRMIRMCLTETPLNQLLAAMNHQNMSSMIIDENLGSDMSNFLRLECSPSETCLGDSLPGVSALYPPGSKGAFRVWTDDSPTVTIDSDDVQLTVPGVLEISVRTGAPTFAEDLLLVADVDLGASLNLSSNGTFLKPRLDVQRFNLTVRPSGVSATIDSKRLGDGLRSFAVDYASRSVQKGFDISQLLPKLGYTFRNFRFSLRPGAVQIDTDMGRS